MTIAPLSAQSGVLAPLAVRTGLTVAEWGLRRAARRSDRDDLQRRVEARALAEAVLAEHDAMVRRSACTLH